MKKLIRNSLEEVLKKLNLNSRCRVEIPADLSRGDYTTNVAFTVASEMQKSPLEAAKILVESLLAKKIKGIEKIEAVSPGFINFWLTRKVLISKLQAEPGNLPALKSEMLQGKKIMVEYAHPNTHKEMHIGHMRTLITGEAISRLLEAAGAKVFCANYQGDIGPHVAKAIFGLKQRIAQGESLIQMRNLSNLEKAHLLGRAYAEGSNAYQDHKDEIDALNTALYAKEGEDWKLYQETRLWSLDYYQGFYTRFETKFDHLFFESEMVQRGKEIVLENIGKIFREENGAVIFPGEEYGLHTRVFITSSGHPTYEAKDLANAYSQYEIFPFERNIHVVASEQAGYFKVVIKVLHLLDYEKFKGEEHLSMGILKLTDRKMSSRTGDVLTVDSLLLEVKENVKKLFASGRVRAEEVEKVTEEITMGAVKYSVLKVGVEADVVFNIEKSIALDGDSGPYLQYTFARTQSILHRSREADYKSPNDILDLALNSEEVAILRHINIYNDIVISAAENYNPSLLCNFLYTLAQKFNAFYQKHQILSAEKDVMAFRLLLTRKVGQTLKAGLNLLGIKSPERM